MKRREFIAGLGSTAAWPVVARAQQPAVPLVAFVHGGSAGIDEGFAIAFRKGLSETGYVDGTNIRIEYHWLNGQYDGLPALMADLVARRVAVIATPASTPAAIAAKAATATVPIVFGVGGDPVTLGLVASVARPGGNATGINFLTQEVDSKRFAFLHELVPTAANVAVLVNPKNMTSAGAAVHSVQDAARVLGLEIQVLNASTSSEIDAAFVAIARDRFGALYVNADGFFTSRRVQLVILAARHGIPVTYGDRDYVTAGGVMSYGTNFAQVLRQGGVYTGNILRGAKPADLPVEQLAKIEFVINLQTARTLGIEVPPKLLALADEVIE
jgi:putative tryptophan/tyrosine transport system substrate-binding protein